MTLAVTPDTSVFLDGIEPFALPLPPDTSLALACGRIGEHAADLFPEERQALGEVGAARLAQFASGRRVAHRALAARGAAQGPVTRRGRLPLWPPGIVGAIAHSASLALALVADRGAFAGVGIDVEAEGRVTGRTVQRLLTERERKRSEGDAATLLFCAKEAVYKAVNPVVGEYLGYQDVEICVGDGFFRARTGRGCESRAAVAAGRGCFVRAHGHWIAAFLVPAAPFDESHQSV